MPVPDSIFKQIKQLIPPLNGKLHKGQSGKVQAFILNFKLGVVFNIHCM